MSFVFDPTDVQYAQDPWPLYQRLRHEAPIHKTPRGFWVLSRHADCLAVLGDRRASSDSMNLDANNLPEGFATSRDRRAAHHTPLSELEADHRPFLFRDPPDHGRLRGLVASAFTPRMIEGLRPRVEAITNELLDEALENGSMDAVAQFAYPIPVKIICEMMGVPQEDQERFSSWSAALARGLDPDFLLTDEVREARLLALGFFAEYFFKLLEERQKNLGPDLLSQLLLAREGGDRLSQGELLSTAILLLVAGHETTVNLLGGAILSLIQNPNELSKLRSDPSIARNAAQEFLRYVSPVQLTGRTMLDDIEVGEVVLPKGQFVLMLLASGNHDEKAFHNPDGLDLGRTDNRHLGFGFGLHHCLGAPLARLEAEIAIPALFRRAKSVELKSAAPCYRDNIVLRGLAELPLSLSAG